MSTIMAAKALSSTLNYPNRSTSFYSPNLRKQNARRAMPYKASQISSRLQMTRIHRLIEEQGIVLMPGCFDALSASIVQKTGFDAGFISGYALSASLLGKPDFGLLTPPEMADRARSVCAAAPLIPIIADADTGGGNALNVQRTVKDLIAAGAAGCFLEDQAWPKKCGHMRGKQVIPAEEHAAKIASARDAIGNSDFFLVARTDARATSAKHGLEDAISRVNLYMESWSHCIWRNLSLLSFKRSCKFIAFKWKDFPLNLTQTPLYPLFWVWKMWISILMIKISCQIIVLLAALILSL